MIERAALYVAEISKASADDKPIKGWASTYDNVDRMGRIMKLGAFGSTLGGKAHGGKDLASFKVPLLAYHEDAKPVGVSEMEPKKSYGMRHGSSYAATDFAKDMSALVDAGAIPATSIGWDPFSSVWDLNEAGNREFTYIDVMENSLCPCPANALAVLDAASLANTGAAPAWEKDIPDWVKELWPDFARLQVQPREVIDLSRAAKGDRDMAAGARNSSQDQEYIQTAHDNLVMAGADCNDGDGDASLSRESAAVWSGKVKNALPDSSFAIVLDGGKKDDDGKTVPRSLRKFPYKDSAGKIDAPHVRNGLARVDGSQLTDAQKTTVKNKLLAAAKEVGIETEEAAALIFRDRAQAPIQGSFEELQEMLREALQAAYPGQYPWLRATYPDSVVYEIDATLSPTGLSLPGGTFRVSYQVDPDDGDVEFGAPEEVDLRNVVIPRPPDDDDDRLASMEIEALELEAEAALA